jgi:hypothetical protein
MDWVSCRAIIFLLRRLLPIAVLSFVGPMSDFFLQLMPSLARKSTLELKIPLVVRRVLDSLPAFANGCICGGTLGANATMVSFASIRSLTFEATLRCPDLNSPSGLLCHRLSSTITLFLKGSSWSGPFIHSVFLAPSPWLHINFYLLSSTLTCSSSFFLFQIVLSVVLKPRVVDLDRCKRRHWVVVQNDSWGVKRFRRFVRLPGSYKVEENNACRWG